MKKFIVISAVLGGLLAVQAQAQTKGFPIADSAGPEPAGAMHVTGNGTFVNDGYVIGGRYTYSIVEDFRAFLDLGAVLPEDADDVLGWQIGGLYSIPAELPLDLGVRLSYYNINEYQTVNNNAEEWGVTALVLGSGVIEGLDNVEGYGGLGFNHGRYEQTARTEFGTDLDGDETELVVVGGLLYHMNDLISFYAEIGYQDVFAGGLGFRLNF